MRKFQGRKRRIGVTIAAAVAAIMVVCGTTPAQAAQPASNFSVLLSTLPTDDNPTVHTGYLRSLFKLWLDSDGNGCNTRAEVLMAETLAALTQHGRCTIDGGSWYSPYDGITLTSARKVDIDHMVPLAEAWDSGASGWTAARRRAFANDLSDPRTIESFASVVQTLERLKMLLVLFLEVMLH